MGGALGRGARRRRPAGSGRGWGKSADGTTVTGPGDFTIDLSSCPAGWSDTEGLTDTTIKIGQAIAQSGTFADYGNFGRGIQTIFDDYGAEGLFTDSEGKTRSVEYIAKDDGYDPARTIPVVDELIDSERTFAIWTLGSPSTLRTYGKINERCVPHPLAMTTHPAWSDPAHHPWTTGAPHPAYSTEAVLWGGFIEERIDSGFGGTVKVADLVMNNDFGKVYDHTFRTYIDESEVLRGKVEYVTENIEAQAPTVKDPMTTPTWPTTRSWHGAGRSSSHAGSIPTPRASSARASAPTGGSWPSRSSSPASSRAG